MSSGTKSSSRPGPQTNSSRNKSASVRRKKKSRPQPVIEDPWADQPADDGYGEDFYDDYGDDYGDDLYADDGDAYGDSYSDDPYVGGLPPPRPKKNRKSSGAQTKKKLKRGEIQDLNTGFLGWVLAGLIGGAVGILLTTLTGYQPYAIFTYLMAIVTGSLVGGAVRYAAGVNDGWVPGLVAAVIGLVAIIGGRVGAFYVSPELNAAFGDEDLTPAQIQARIDKAASEDSMIETIAVDQVEYLEEVMSQIGVTEQQIDDHYENVAEDAPIRDHYLPQVWDEATRRWNLLPQAERESRMWTARIEEMASYDVLDEDTMKSHIEYMQSDFEMTKRVARKPEVGRRVETAGRDFR